jgi:hypothetical protein
LSELGNFLNCRSRQVGKKKGKRMAGELLVCGGTSQCSLPLVFQVSLSAELPLFYTGTVPLELPLSLSTSDLLETKDITQCVG